MLMILMMIWLIMYKNTVSFSGTLPRFCELEHLGSLQRDVSGLDAAGNYI